MRTHLSRFVCFHLWFHVKTNYQSKRDVILLNGLTHTLCLYQFSLTHIRYFLHSTNRGKRWLFVVLILVELLIITVHFMARASQIDIEGRSHIIWGKTNLFICFYLKSTCGFMIYFECFALFLFILAYKIVITVMQQIMLSII